MPTRFCLCAVALPLALAVAGCATPVGPVEVTRFHRAAAGAPLASGGVRVVAPDAPGDSLMLEPYTGAVLRELQRVGYRTAGDDRPDFIAEVRVERVTAPALDARSPVSVGVGGSTGGYGSGVGVGIGLNLSGPPKPEIATTLSVRIRRDSPGEAATASGETLWEGRASDRAREGSPAVQPGIAAARLAEALFAGFPGQSGETISVP